MTRSVRHRLVTVLLLLLAAPVCVVCGATLLRGRHYALISLLLVILAMVPLFFRFERRTQSVYTLTAIAVMTAVTIVSRLLLAPLGGVKPVTALIVLTGLYFGPDAGFLVGALSAFLSNFYFGQGAWTPFQMFAWGLTGLLAGLLAVFLKRHRPVLVIFGGVMGVLYSFILDINTVLWFDGTFSLRRYVLILASSLPFTVTYAVTNVIFLLILAPLLGPTLDRVTRKYGL